MIENDFIEELRRKTGYYRILDATLRKQDEFMDNMSRVLAHQGSEEKPGDVKVAIHRAMQRHKIISSQIKKSLFQKQIYDIGDIRVENMPRIGFTGLALKGPNSGKIVLIDHYLHHILVRVSTLLGECFHITLDYKNSSLDKAVWSERLGKYLWGISGVIEQFMTNNFNQKVENAFQYEGNSSMTPRGESTHLGYKLADTMNCFVVAHELAHHVLDHTKEGINIITEDGRIDYESIGKARENEFAADSKAIEILLLVKENHLDYVPFLEISSLWFGPLLLFKIFEVVEGKSQKDRGLSLHPPAKDRLENIEKLIRPHFLDHPNEHVYDFMKEMLNGVSLIKS